MDRTKVSTIIGELQHGEFANAVLVDRSINEGQVLLTDENWYKDEPVPFSYYELAVPYINSELETFAANWGMYWEWVNPSVIALCEL